MTDLLKKLNYKDEKRIALINADDEFFTTLIETLPGIIIDREIDKRCPYAFMLIFAYSLSDVKVYVPDAIHNLTSDGKLWFCFPKNGKKGNKKELGRDSGWELLNKSGFFGVRVVSVDNNWSAIRFRNIKFIKSTSGRFKTV